MDPRITAQLVTLDPAKADEQELCQLVINETRAYLHGEPLCPLKDSGGNLRTVEWLQHYCSTPMECLFLQHDRLERQFTGSSAPVPISQAWRDWQARHEALEPLQQCADSAYVAALDELLSDLHAQTSEEDWKPAASEAHYVSILVRLTFHSNSLTLCQGRTHSADHKTSDCQLSRTPMAMYMRMVCCSNPSLGLRFKHLSSLCSRAITLVQMHQSLCQRVCGTSQNSAHGSGLRRNCAFHCHCWKMLCHCPGQKLITCRGPLPVALQAWPAASNST